MYEFYPYYTNDGSVGLFSPKDDDIYHSTYGALSEAYEKFILPSNINDFIKKNSEIKILDICFGIGYNSKSFFDYFFKAKNACNDTIDINNILCNNIFVTAIDTDKNLSFLSPFFVTNKKNVPKDKINFQHEKISKLLKKCSSKKYKLDNAINILLLKKIIEADNSILDDEEFHKILFNKKYSPYFDIYMLNLFKFYQKGGYKETHKGGLSTFLHNIYYKYLSTRHKKALKHLKNNKITFNLIINDARKALIDDKNLYNYIFLDAFTPAKCPCLWTLDFFRLLYDKLDKDGMILTYSNAASVRNAFLEAGFHVGKIYNSSSSKFMGTIAVKNKDLIKHELSEYDLGLLKTKAGIVYRDEELNGLNEAIIAAHSKTVSASELQSSSKYIKQFKGAK